jgi:hypothetical protein
MLAIEKGDISTIQALLDAGADIEAKTTPDMTALLIAARWGHTETVLALLAAGAGIEAKTTRSWTALHWAALSGHTETVQALIAAGADIEAKNEFGNTALDWPAPRGYTATVLALIAAGALANQTNWNEAKKTFNHNRKPYLYALVAHKKRTPTEVGDLKASNPDYTAQLDDLSRDINVINEDRKIEGLTPKEIRFFTLIEENSMEEASEQTTVGGPYTLRGDVLKLRDKQTRDALVLCKTLFNTNVLTRIWDDALHRPLWQGRPVWVHGDLHAGNVLVDEGRITSILDWGCSGVGDPAVDLMLAWTLLSKNTRSHFKSIVNPSSDTWARGRGWAVTFGVVAFTHYRQSNPTLSDTGKRTLEQVLSDQDFL